MLDLIGDEMVAPPGGQGGSGHDSGRPMTRRELLARALKSVVDADRFAAFSGTRSLPFTAGEHGRIAVKVIDPRGNEVMRVIVLGETRY